VAKSFKSFNLWQKNNRFVSIRSKKKESICILFSCFFFLKKMEQDKKLLIKLAHTKMPFGKYEGRFLIDLPEYYVVWYHNKGFPKGELGQQLQLIYELKLNGLEELIRNIKKQYPKPN
jgi:uncharacterized protein